MPLTRHSRQRAYERLHVCSKKEVEDLFRLAKQQGYSPIHFVGEFKQYLLSKQCRKNKCSVKVYNNYIFIHKPKTLITVYKVPEKYLPISNYFATNVESNPLYKRMQELSSTYEFKLIDKCPQPEFNETLFLTVLYVNDCFELFGVGDSIPDAQMNALSKYFNRR